MKKTQVVIERRFISDMEIRLDEGEAGKPRIVGHAAVFDQPVELWPGMREVVRRGAFGKTIGESDIRGLFNHDPNWVLGRNRAGTLELQEDEKGLAYRIAAPETDLVRDLVLEPIRRGDVSGSSFGFRVIRETITGEDQDLRELQEVRLYDVGPVTFPAYPQADSQLRSLLADCSTLDEIKLLAALRGTGLTDVELRQMIVRVNELLEVEETADGMSPDLALRRLQLEESAAA